MSTSSVSPIENESTNINLRNPWSAGFLAWLVPGLGHFYQKRYHKAFIFFLCIVPMFIVGCVLASSSEVGTARNVYWSWRDGDKRFWWLAQAPLGIAAIPSWTQSWQLNNRQSPVLGNFMVPPKRYHEDKLGISPTMDEIRKKIPHFELGTYLTVIAGLMNLLVIFDAVDGPFLGRRKEEKSEVNESDPLLKKE